MLYDLARARAAVLRTRGADATTPVAIAGPTAPEWFAWVVAVWMLGGTAVPLPVPIRVRDRDALRAQFAALVDAFDCRLVAAHDRYAGAVPPDLLVPWADAGSTPGGLADDEMAVPDPDSIALIRMTSGSIALPKGVARTHKANSATTLDAMTRPEGLDAVRHLVYAPCAHGGGFQGVFAPLHPWLEMHMLQPERFARDPGSFLRMVGEHDITTLLMTSSGASAAVRAIERNADGVDLSGLERITLSMEMIDADLIDRLIDIGGRSGLRPEVVCASYGLAEGGFTFTDRGVRIAIDVVDLDGLVTDGVARPPEPGRPTKRVVSCGRPVGQELRIAGDAGPLPERHLGDIQFRSPLLMHGYVGATDENPFDDDGWMSTGDIGYLAKGELYVTGRIKEVVVQQGRKYHPEDLEWSAAHALGVERSACVAFAPLGAGDGEITVAVEIENADPDEVGRLVRAAVLNSVGVTVRTVLTLAPGTLPKGSTGKNQRLAARDWLASNRIAE
jgi:fatty-acyl-CoA synthase